MTSPACNSATLATGGKSGSKYQNLSSEGGRAYICSPIDSSRRADHFGLLESQNRMKNDGVMATQRSAKSGCAANYGPINGYFSVKPLLATWSHFAH